MFHGRMEASFYRLEELVLNFEMGINKKVKVSAPGFIHNGECFETAAQNQNF